MILIILLLSLFAASYALVGIYRRQALALGMLDIPNHRSAHSSPIPHGAGLVFGLLWVGAGSLFAFFYNFHFIYAFFIPSAILIGLSYVDDKRGLSPVLRGLVHFACALFCVANVIFLAQQPGWLLLGISFIFAFCITWSINLYNFMDGIDSFAGMQAIVMLLTSAGIFYHFQAMSLMILSLMLVAVLMGFLLWNFPPAKIFMGDTGSSFLGFIFPAMALYAHVYYAVPLAAFFILYGLFIFDSTITLLRRILARETFYLPHNKHAYQRLVQMGWSHKQVVLASLAVNLVLAILAVLSIIYPYAQYAIVFVCICGLFILYWQIESHKPMFASVAKV